MFSGIVPRMFTTQVWGHASIKVERHLKGYGNQAVYKDREEGDNIAVTLYRLSSTEYDTVRDLERALQRTFGEYPAPVIEPIRSVSAELKGQSCLAKAKKAARGFFVVVVCYWILRFL